MNSVDFSHVAALARLSFSEEEQVSLREDMSVLLRLAEEIAHAEGACSCEPTDIAPLREDHPAASLSCDEILSAAPAVTEGYVTVPPVLSEVAHG